MCSIHYPAISPIVEQTAKEFGIPYNCNKTFSEAVASHYRTLKQFGDPDFKYEEESTLAAAQIDNFISFYALTMYLFRYSF